MQGIINKLRVLEGVKAVRREGEDVLKIQLFTKEIPETEAVEIHGDLRSISQKLVNTLNEGKGEEYGRWNWIQKPEKKYQETSLGGRSGVTDRKEKGHKPGFYKVVLD